MEQTALTVRKDHRDYPEPMEQTVLMVRKDHRDYQEPMEQTEHKDQ